MNQLPPDDINRQIQKYAETHPRVQYIDVNPALARRFWWITSTPP